MATKTITAKKAAALSKKFVPVNAALERIRNGIHEHASVGLTNGIFYVSNLTDPELEEVATALKADGFSVEIRKLTDSWTETVPADFYESLDWKYKLKKLLRLRPISQTVVREEPTGVIQMNISW